MKTEILDSADILSEEDFLFYKEKIFKLAGISLTSKKMDLVRSRIKSYIHKNGISSFAAYRAILETALPNSEVVQTFINLLTTNKTDFFREEKHFDYLIHHVIENWKKEGKKEVSVWCCASSTGEEPYTIAMVLDRFLPPDINFKILASDIDTKVLDRARNGVYSISKFSEIPKIYQDDYITVGRGDAEGWFRIKDHLHSKIVFKKHNLIENSYPGDEIFDLIFCRNVLIYFSPDTIRELMKKLHRSLKAGGTLLIGHSESIQGTTNLFRSEKPAVYMKVGA